jgi:general secretion pathway protein K
MMFRSTSFGRPRRHNEGFILIAVLWIIGALATFAATYAFYVANAAVSLAISDDRIKAEGLIMAGVELAVYRMNVKPSAEELPPASDAFRFRLGGARVNVEYWPENIRIDLNVAPKPLLAGLFRVLGASTDNANTFADRIIAWRTPRTTGADDPEPSRYRTAGLNYGPRQAPFVHADELWRVAELPPALVERALPFVTVYSGQAEVDTALAPPTVIAALPGMTPERLDAFLMRRRDIRQNDASVGPPGVAVRPSKARRIGVGITFDNGRRVDAEVVAYITENGKEPYRILSWHNDFDSPGTGLSMRAASQ